MCSKKQGFAPKNHGALLLVVVYLFVVGTYLFLIPKLTGGIDSNHHFVLKRKVEHNLVIQRADKTTFEEKKDLKRFTANPGIYASKNYVNANSIASSITIRPVSQPPGCSYHYLLNRSFRI